MKSATPIPTLTVTGHGRVRVPPDRIVVTLEIDALTPTVDHTQRTLEALRERLSAARATADVDAHRVSSSGPQLAPQVSATTRAERHRAPTDNVVVTHARIEFSEAIRGPPLVGDRRYQGLGLFGRNANLR